MSGSETLREALLAFSELFRTKGMRYPWEAAAYYVLYTHFSPNKVSFSMLLRSGRDLANSLSRRALLEGREELLNHGFIAKVMFEPKYETKSFGSESYFPANPELVWREEEEILSESFGNKHIQLMRSSSKKLSKMYDKWYGNYKAIKGQDRITVVFSGLWVYYLVLNHLIKKQSGDQPHIYSLVGGTGSSIDSYKRNSRILETGANMRIILSSHTDIAPLKHIKKRYGDNLRIRLNPLETTRRITILDNELGIDCIKILPTNLLRPNYIGILYTAQDYIQIIKEDFEAKWQMYEELTIG